jgi:hypothetical protein
MAEAAKVYQTAEAVVWRVWSEEGKAAEEEGV